MTNKFECDGMPRKDDDIKQLVAEIRNLREELARVKDDVAVIKKSLESEKQLFFVKCRQWDSSADE